MMKHWIQRRFLPVLLCMALALCLTACGGQDEPPAGSQTGGIEGTLSGSKGGKSDTAGAPSASTDRPKPESTPLVDPELAGESLALLRESMAWYSEQAVTGAVAYLGYREEGDTTPLSDWLQESFSGLTEAMPFLLNIPDERILGTGWGYLYCLVPRNENTTLTAHHVTWESSEHRIGPVMDQVIYQAKSDRPVLICAAPAYEGMPDIHITMKTGAGQEMTWFPLVDEYDVPIVPCVQDDIPFLMDFAIWGYTTGLDYPDDWDPSGEQEPPGPVRWWTPSEEELADTTWTCEHWLMELHGDTSDPDYSGTVDLYYRESANQAYELFYVGAWRMEGDRLRLELFDGAFYSIEGSFPVEIDSTGEYLYIEQDWETGVYPPFLDENTCCIDLTRSYG